MTVIGMDLRRRNLLELVLGGPGRSARVTVGDARAGGLPHGPAHPGSGTASRVSPAPVSTSE